MKHITLACLILLLFACCRKYESDIPTPPVILEEKPNLDLEVISLIGQSNIPGRTLVSDLTQEDQAKMQFENRAVYIMAYNSKSANEFQIATPGVNVAEYAERCGIQVFLGQKLLKQGTKDFYLFQPGASGRFIKAFQPGEEMGTYITKSIKTIKDYATQKSKVAVFKYAVWYQGEAEAVRTDWDSSYYRKELEKTIVNFRKEFATDTKFIIIQFPMDYRQVPKKNLIEMRDVQRKIGSQRNNILLEATETDRTYDGIHLNLETYQSKAEAIYKIIH